MQLNSKNMTKKKEWTGDILEGEIDFFLCFFYTRGGDVKVPMPGVTP